jgi:hypothetical protein
MKEKCIVTVASKSVKEEARDRVRLAQERSWPCNSQKSPKVAASKKRREMGRTLLLCLSLGRANGGGGGRGGRRSGRKVEEEELLRLTRRRASGAQNRERTGTNRHGAGGGGGLQVAAHGRC